MPGLEGMSFCRSSVRKPSSSWGQKADLEKPPAAALELAGDHVAGSSICSTDVAASPAALGRGHGFHFLWK